MADEGAKVIFSFTEERPIGALELSSFIFDINRIYASTVISALELQTEKPQGRRFRASRSAFELPAPYSLSLARIRFESPGLLEIMTATSLGVGAFWVLLQCFEKIANWPLNRAKLRLEVEKLERERPQAPRPRRIEPYLDLPPIKGAIRQLTGNPLRPSNVDLVLHAPDLQEGPTSRHQA